MIEPTIVCPKCHTEIKLTESLAAPLIETVRREYEQRLAQQNAEMKQRETALREQENALAKAKASLDEQVAERLKQERAKIAEEEARKAKLAFSMDLEDKAKELASLQEILRQRNEKLAEAQKAQADLLKKQRELDDRLRELDLTIERRVQESLVTEREKAKKEAEASLNLKVMEKDHIIASMQRQIEELKRKAEQGSQQLQGEVQELELEALLSTKFPLDRIQPVPKGEHGGDILHQVIGPMGQSCGTILWETKRTKHWSDGWLAKLRQDQRAAKAEIAVLVSQALPKDVESFELIEHVWVTHPRAALPVAVALRHLLMEVTLARQASEGQHTKMELVYQYLMGPRFRQRVQAIVEAFTTMQEDLDKERKVMIKQWAKREEQIDRVMQATVGMYGDLQGIAGKSLQEIEGLSWTALNSPDDEQPSLL